MLIAGAGLLYLMQDLPLTGMFNGLRVITVTIVGAGMYLAGARLLQDPMLRLVFHRRKAEN